MTTIRFPSAWIARAHDALGRLADHPWALFVVLLAINSIARPYAGITHDTRLYSVQVLNRVEDGSYADDLFFRYGSQDQYSLFSRLAAPLVQSLGLPVAFFLIYLLSKTLLIWGMIRLVRTLVPNRAAVALALGYCMVVTIHYGGQYILNVQEMFLTPRLPAIALVLIGLDFALRGRPIVSGIVLLGAAAIHPLMACGGLLIWGAYQLWTWFGLKTFIGVTAALCLCAAGVLAYEPLGKRCFGEMDEAWRETILSASPFNFASEWNYRDWCYLAFQLAITGVVIWRYHAIDPSKTRFLVVVLMVTILAVVGTDLGERLPYALLLQGQPYRAMWVLAFLHLAFVFWLFVEWAQHPAQSVQLAACGLLAYLCWYDGLWEELALPVFAFALFVVPFRGLERKPRDSAWVVHGIQCGLIVGAIVWMVYKFFLLSIELDALNEMHNELRDLVEVYLKNLGPILLLLGLAFVLTRFGRFCGRRAVWATAAGCLALQTALFTFPETVYYREHCTRYRKDLRDIREVIHRQGDRSRPLPTVYSNVGCLDYVWLDLHAKSYFDWWQAGGFMFRREMAMEGQRRACLVAAFEIERCRRFEKDMTDEDKYNVGRFFKADFDQTRLSAKDFARLCQEPGLDYLVLEQQIDGLPSSQYGRLYLYRCHQVRAALGLPEPGAGTAVAVIR
jgi:hypothetical protein